MKSQSVPALLLIAALAAAQANATFPVQPIDCAVFDPEDPSFLGEHFGFATELSYDNFFDPPMTTGMEGFLASPEQVAAIPDFANGADLPTGGQTLADLFPGGVGQPDTINQGEISQSIQGQGDFGAGFSEVTISQRKRLSADQDPDGVVSLFAQGKAFAPFEVVSAGEGPVDASLTIDLFSTFDFSEGGSLSEFLGVALVDLTDPDNPSVMESVSGFYFVDGTGPFASFTRGENSQQDVSDSFFTGPHGADPDVSQLASFFYTIETQLTPGGSYGLGLVGDGAIGISGSGVSWLDSSNTLTGTIEVLTPGARLVLPGFVVPEPAACGLVLLCGIVARLGGRPPRRRP